MAEFISDKDFEAKYGANNQDFVSDSDFEAKYGGDVAKMAVNRANEKLGTGGFAGLLKGAAKGAVSTLVGASSLGERILNKPYEALGLRDKIDKTAAEKIVPDKFRTPEGSAENIGFGVEQIAEFLLPGGASTKISKAAESSKILSKTPKIIQKIAPLATKMTAEAGVVGGQSAIQEGKVNEDVRTNAIIAAAFPALGKLATKTLDATGAKIQDSIIKPSIRDVKDGFKVENINKYGLGGNLQTMLSKTANKMNELSGKLKDTLANSNEEIDLAEVYYDTAKSLLKDKTKNFGNIRAINRVLTNLADELDEVAPNLKANLTQATQIKRGAGTKGSWVYGSADPDSSAVESVYNTFYHKLRKNIENKGTEEIKSINKQLSELIPVQNALLRRIPVAERNNLLSLTDNIGLFASVFDPRALALIGAKKLSMSGNFANVLLKASENLKKTPAIGERIFK